MRVSLASFIRSFRLNVWQHTVAAAVAVNRNALAAALPSRAVHVGDERFGDIVRQVHRHRDRMVHPFLDRTLHLDFRNPVDVIGRGAVVGRSRHPLVQLGIRDGLQFGRIVSVRVQPLDEIVVVDVVLLKLFARFVLVIDVRVVVRRDLILLMQKIYKGLKLYLFQM